jgi:hypothetical protein
MNWKIRRADIIDWAVRYDGPKFHALLCDAPYHLGPGGFMGKGWDASGVSFRPETWAALAQHLHPGAFLFVFAGAINDDLISVAMRRAGLRKHYKMLAWVYGQGMPKGTRIDDQVYDEDTGQYQFCSAYGEARHRRPSRLLSDRLPPTLLAGIWKGHRYGLQSLKPALEPVLVFQKPYSKPMNDITRTGAGVLNIDEARIATNDDLGGGGEELTSFADKEGWDRPWMHDPKHQEAHANKVRENVRKAERLGRYPPNLVLAHHPLCRRVGTQEIEGDKREGGNGSRPGGFLNVGADSGTSEPNGTLYGDEVVTDWCCHPDCAVLHLAQQSEDSGAAARAKGSSASTKVVYGPYAQRSHVYHDDEGTAARFFPQAGWDVEVAEALSNEIETYYTAKSSPKERDAGLGTFPLRRCDNAVNRLSQAMGEEGSARGAGCGPKRNIHPTVKPVALAEWLATLLLPPVQYGPRRILVPFAGSGSEALGAMLAGWEHVTLVEQNLNYCAIAANRLAWWWPRVRQGMTDVKAILDTWHKPKSTETSRELGDLPLFETLIS